MRPNNYDQKKDREFANEEFGRQAWNEYMEEEPQEDTTSTSSDTGHIRLSRKAERDLLEFSNDKLRRNRSRKNNPAYVAVIGAIVGVIAVTAVTFSVIRSNNDYYYEPDIQEYNPEEDPYYYEYEYELGEPYVEIDGISYMLPTELQELLNNDLHIDHDVYDMIGSEPMEVSLYTDYDQYVGKLVLVSPDGSEIPVGKSRIVGFTSDSQESWVNVGSRDLAVGYTTYSLDDMLKYSSCEWTKTGSGAHSHYDITNKLEDGSTLHLDVDVEDDIITSITMRIE